jgi:hypothetical protein
MKRILGLAILVSFFAACGHVGIPKVEYREGIKAVRLGMTKTEFFTVFPDAVLKASREFPETKTTYAGVAELVELDIEYTDSLEHGSVAYAWSRSKSARRVWFYFFNDHLTQYGTADSWDTFSPGVDAYKDSVGR